MLTAVIIVVIALVIAAAPILYWRYRSPSDIHISERLRLEVWTAVPPDAHHSNTDLFKFGDQYILAHATSPWHFASRKCRLVIRSSRDGRDWKVLAEIMVPGQDVRDPKLALIQGKLFLYFLSNANKFQPEPTGTSYCVSSDAKNWSAPQELSSMKGWLIWRPKTHDGVTFYAPAYWWEHGRTMLFKTTDGVNWSEVGPIYSGEKNDETAISFRPDGTMVLTGRLEVDPNFWGYHPEGHTLIGVSSHPYTKWSFARSHETRLDGPYLFQIGERTYACGRRHVGGKAHMGSVWETKRTSLYLVLPDQLVFLSDLPSSGDTSYAGVVVDRDDVLISYYTSPPNRDYIWLMGMLSKSSIEMARFKVSALEELADEKLAHVQD
ncbi:MAG: exo-alpha-sialidase [Candidatus Abyssobacteria bacterium SURF_17]|uniref:Exo-alpha-sialidase n=1 Tax=Candidatus Abyssobacteria bacterium SURF_17 TaxID=2093361 RepID=A0A419ETM6_9BACT|nr:MAG: exo-alpha-sialidase [Candidatus Abyssubacteria bacterium SURF_17]